MLSEVLHSPTTALGYVELILSSVSLYHSGPDDYGDTALTLALLDITIQPISYSLQPILPSACRLSRTEARSDHTPALHK